MLFRDFMEMALYYPELGYYTSAHEKLGPRGDYYTSPVLSELFGQMIARQLEEMWCAMGKGAFTLIEFGAGTGILCNDILNYLKSHSALYDHISYCIIEKSGTMCAQERQIIRHEGKVNWYRSVIEIGAFTSCVFTNEVLDNFSIHQVIMKQELMEVCVDYTNGFTETTIPASPILKSYLEEEHVKLPANYRTEINLQAKEWITDVAGVLDRGFVLTIDYGYPSWEYYHPRRSAGTLMCYHQQKVSENPYEHVGHKDITAHVNFSALNRGGMRYGLVPGGFTNQNNFLHSLGLVNCIRTLEHQKKSGKLNEKDFRQVITLLYGMGNKFKVLMQHKNVSVPRLTGMMCCNPL